MTWIASLWSSSPLWEGVEYTAEALVVICALIEVLADFEHILKGDENRVLRKRAEKRAAIGLVIGLGVGLGALVRTNSLFTDTIASAYREARDANDRAKDANGKAKVASDKAASAQDRADKAETQAGVAIKQAALLNKQAEDERTARVKIEDAVAWRRLSKSHISEFGSSLAMYTRQLTALAYNTSDLEAYSFATDIDVALHEFAHWNIAEPQAILKMREGPVNFGTNPPLERGVVVSSTSDQGSRAAAKAILEKLSALGFDTTLGKEFSNARPTVDIFVEPRPEGPQGAAKLRAEHEKSRGASSAK